ncbi:MAG: hypothetical protein AB7T59_00625 [Hyphomonadaceae bacterium]
MRKIAVAVALTLSGCASAGPTNSPEFAALVTAALPPDAGVVQVSGPGTWTPNSRHMIEFQNNGNLIPDASPWKNGVTTITPAGLFFAEWEQRTRQYVVTKRIPRSNLASATIEQIGRSCALIVQEAHDSTFHVFEFVRGGGTLNDCATARAAEAALISFP